MSRCFPLFYVIDESPTGSSKMRRCNDEDDPGTREAAVSFSLLPLTALGPRGVYKHGEDHVYRDDSHNRRVEIAVHTRHTHDS